MSEHVHGMECYKILLSCGKSEHSHNAGCFDKHNLPKCLLTEHSHSTACNTRTLMCRFS